MFKLALLAAGAVVGLTAFLLALAIYQYARWHLTRAWR